MGLGSVSRGFREHDGYSPLDESVSRGFRERESWV